MDEMISVSKQAMLCVARMLTPGGLTEDYIDEIIATAEPVVGGLEWGPEKEDVTWYEAKDWCESLGDGWRMPARWELLYAYETGVEGFASGSYWSCAECGSTDAWYQYIPNGCQGSIGKSSIACVRAVREVGNES